MIVYLYVNLAPGREQGMETCAMPGVGTLGKWAITQFLGAIGLY